MAANYGETAMKKIQVNCIKLLKTLRENLDKHKAEYNRARSGYYVKRDKAIRHVGKVAIECTLPDQKNEVHTAYSALQKVIRDKPIDRSESYVQAIAFMEWETRKTIKVSLNDFECYVRDNWSWRADHRSKMLSNSL